VWVKEHVTLVVRFLCLSLAGRRKLIRFCDGGSGVYYRWISDCLMFVLGFSWCVAGFVLGLSRGSGCEWGVGGYVVGRGR
jgi:hypothetical protein